MSSSTGTGTKKLPRLSRAAENYLLSLAILREDGVSPHLTELASFLRQIPPEEEVGTTLPSVSGMLQRMAREGLLSITKDKEIALTAAGEEQARDVVRRHRLAERLLVDVLGVPLDRAESEAHALEHAISPALLTRIEEKLGHPQTCPYGRPIYQPDEKRLRTDEPGTFPLSQAQPGRGYVVVRIPDVDYPLLRFLVGSYILPGQRIEVAEVAGYRGVVDLTVAGERVSLGMEQAARIRVRAAA